MKHRVGIMQVLAVVLLFLSIVISPAFAQEKREKPEEKDQKEQQEPTIKIGTTIVVVPVIVTDHYGRFVTGLSRSNFSVREDNVEQSIEEFSSSEAPFSVALLLDTSRSTVNKLAAIRKAALEFCKQLQPRDRVMIVTFDERVHFLNDFTNNLDELRQVIKPIKSSYLTSLYDAIYLTITEKMSKVQGRKAIVVLTDGVDTASKKATFESVLDLVASSDIISYSIQYETRNDGAPVMRPLFIPNVPCNYYISRFSGASFNWQDPQQKSEPEKEGGKAIINIPRPDASTLSPDTPSTQDSRPGSKPSTRINSQAPQIMRDRYLIAADFLRALAAQSGAIYMRAETIESTAYAFNRIAVELRNQYTITYNPTNEAQDGNYRSIRVGTVNINSDDLIVRSRLGYRAPKAESVAVPSPGTTSGNPPKNNF